MLPTDFWAAEILDNVSASGVSGSSESTLATSSFSETPLCVPSGSGDGRRFACRRTLCGLDEVNEPEEIEGIDSACFVAARSSTDTTWEMETETVGSSARALMLSCVSSSLRMRDLRAEAEAAGKGVLLFGL